MAVNALRAHGITPGVGHQTITLPRPLPCFACRAETTRATYYPDLRHDYPFPGYIMCQKCAPNGR